MVVCWITTVAAVSWLPPEASAGRPSMPISQPTGPRPGEGERGSRVRRRGSGGDLPRVGRWPAEGEADAPGRARPRASRTRILVRAYRLCDGGKRDENTARNRVSATATPAATTPVSTAASVFLRLHRMMLTWHRFPDHANGGHDIRPVAAGSSGPRGIPFTCGACAGNGGCPASPQAGSGPRQPVPISRRSSSLAHFRSSCLPTSPTLTGPQTHGQGRRSPGSRRLARCGSPGCWARYADADGGHALEVAGRGPAGHPVQAQPRQVQTSTSSTGRRTLTLSWPVSPSRIIICG